MLVVDEGGLESNPRFLVRVRAKAVSYRGGHRGRITRLHINPSSKAVFGIYEGRSLGMPSPADAFWLVRALHRRC